jgi:hypothetical protein
MACIYLSMVVGGAYVLFRPVNFLRTVGKLGARVCAFGAHPAELVHADWRVGPSFLWIIGLQLIAGSRVRAVSIRLNVARSTSATSSAMKIGAGKVGACLGCFKIRQLPRLS